MTLVLDQAHGEKFSLYHSDCVEGMRAILDNSVDYSVFSPPFQDLYVYGNSTNDIGNNRTKDEFFNHYRFLITEQFRTLKPGRLLSFHCMNLPATKQTHGHIGLRDFRGDLIRAYEDAGFIYHSEVCIWKDPVTAVTRTKALGLLYKQLKKDSAMSRQGIPDYLVTMRKPGANPDPVTKDPTEFPVDLWQQEASPVWNYGENDPPVKQLLDWLMQFFRKPESLPMWQRYQDAVWMDINPSDTLQYRSARENNDERHICLAQGSLVLTYECGYIPIEQVEVGQIVLTHEGRWKPVTAKRCNGVREIIKATAQGVANLRVTPDHRLWTRKARTTHPRHAARGADPTWVEACGTLGSYVNLKLPPIEESPLSADEWWVIGRWLGDGHRDARGHLHISCGRHEFEALTNRLGSYVGAIHDTGTSLQITVKDADGRLRGQLSRCGNGAAGKTLPGEAIALEPAKAEALLSGYLSADGHYVPRYDRWTASSVSRALLLGMAMVAQRARGVVASVYAGREGGESEICGRTVQTRDEWVMSIPPRNLSAMLLNDGAWKKVRRLEDAGEAEVWDIQVADDASFTAEGCIVHNCPLQLEVIRRAIRLWTNPGDVVLSPFAGIGSELVVALEMGRRALGFELKGSYFKQAVRNCQLAEQKAHQPSLFDLLDAA